MSDLEQALQQVLNRAQPHRHVIKDQSQVAEGHRERPQGLSHGEDRQGVIFAIFGGDKPGHKPSQRQAYCKEAYRDSMGM